jgi:hypothetical protein
MHGDSGLRGSLRVFGWFSSSDHNYLEPMVIVWAIADWPSNRPGLVALAQMVDNAVRESRQDDWRSNAVKVRRLLIAIKSVLRDDEALTEQILELVKNQYEY